LAGSREVEVFIRLFDAAFQRRLITPLLFNSHNKQHFQTNQQPTQTTNNMSDSMRKGLGEQASEKSTSPSLTHPRRHHANPPPVKPDSTKSNTEKAGESISGLGDKAASAVQPGTSPLFPHYLYHIH
jgi:hypothetical protein